MVARHEQTRRYNRIIRLRRRLAKIETQFIRKNKRLVRIVSNAIQNQIRSAHHG
jgi:hypothetical protein